MWDWTGLQYLLAVAETGNQSAAARRLGVSQPTVGRRLARLEADLDTRLHDSTPDGIVLTPAGERLLKHARRIEQEALAARRTIGGGDSALEGTVRISAIEALGITWLTPALARLHAIHPGIRIELLIENAAVNLLRREADIAVRLFRPAQDALVARHLGRHAMGLYASHAYLDAHGAPDTLDDLARGGAGSEGGTGSAQGSGSGSGDGSPRESSSGSGAGSPQGSSSGSSSGDAPSVPGAAAGHAVIGFDESVSHFPQARWLDAHVPAERVVFRSNSNLVQIAATCSGLGIGLLSCFIADRDPELIRLLPAVETPSHELWLVTHADLRRSARIRAVYDYLAELITRQKAALAGHPAG